MPSSITLTVAHLPTSTSFFLSALQPLNYVFRGRQDQTIGFGPAVPASAPADFWITQEIPGVPAGAAHVAFPAASRAQVEEFFVAALKAGGKIRGEPSQRDASGYFSAAVIDFDGNSIEAVYRPTATTTGDNVNTVRSGSGSVVSRSSTKAPPSTIVSEAKSRAGVAGPSAVKGIDGKSALTVAKAKGPASTVVSSASHARSKAAAAPPSVVSQACSVTAPATDFYDGPIAFGLPTEVAVPAPTQMQMQMSSLAEPVNVGGGGVGGSGSGGGGGDVLNALINEARTAASVARDLVNSVKPHLNSQESAAAPVTTDQAGGGVGSGSNNNNNNGNGAGEAIVGTLLGVAAGAALHYAFSNRSKENGALHHQDQGQTGLDGGGLGGSALQRPSVIGRNVTDPTPLPLRTEYAYEYAASSNGDGRGVYHYNNQYYYTGEEESQGHAPQRLITMHDNTSYLSLPAPGPASRAGSKNVKSATGSVVGSEATTVRPVPVPVQVPQSHDSASKAASSWSQLSATSSKKSSSTSNMSVKMKMAPPTSYRAPTVLTAAETGLPGGGVAASAAGSHRARSSHSKPRSRATSVGTKPGSSTRHSSHVRSRSQSQSGSHASTIKPVTVAVAASTTSTSRRSRRDQFEDDWKTIVHVPEQTTSSHVSKSHHSTTSKVSLPSGYREPHQYPLPPSRAATWAGSDHGAASRGGGGGGGGDGGSGSLMSSTGGVLPGHPVSAPRTIIGKLNPLHRNSGGGGGGGGGGAAKQNDTVSVVSKQKDLEDLDVTDREVRPEDSVSQVSVGSKGSRRSKRSGTSRR
ncbi:hypothetical protein ABEF95_016873 [Exophiala dermatitidis]